MEKTQKRIFGFLGLVVVAAMTFLAALLPSPTTSAISSVTDTITVRVVGSSPDVNISVPKSGSIFTSATQSIKFDYGNVGTITLYLTKTNLDGSVYNTILTSQDVEYNAGDGTFSLNLNGVNLGYGEYVVRLVGEGAAGLSDEDAVAFSYYPVYGEAETDDDTGETYIDLDYDPYDETGVGTGEVVEIEINVFYEDGKLVNELSPINVTPPETRVTIPFDEHEDLPAGTYTIKISAYDKDGNELYTAYLTYVIREKGEVIPVPDTGNVFKNLNISKADYLITGIIIFLLVGIFGIVYIAKKQKSTRGRRR